MKKKNKIFCPNCEKVCGYRISVSSKMFEPKPDIWLSYNELTTYCRRCGAEVYVPKINDENCKRREQAYEKDMEERIFSVTFDRLGPKFFENRKQLRSIYANTLEENENEH